MAALTVLIAGFEGAFGVGLRSVIASDPELRVVDVGGLFNVRALMVKQRPSVLLLKESALPDVMELRRLVVTHPATGVVVGVMELERERDQALLAAGARMVVPLTTDESELRAALRLVARGLVGPPRVTAAAGIDGLSLLTDRETEVFELLVRRLTAREIADMLQIAVPTVNAHTRRVYEKLGVHNRAELEDRTGRAFAEHAPPEMRQRKLSRDRLDFGGRSSQARNGARLSALDMRAAMGVARWPRSA